MPRKKTQKRQPDAPDETYEDAFTDANGIPLKCKSVTLTKDFLPMGLTADMVLQAFPETPRQGDLILFSSPSMEHSGCVLIGHYYGQDGNEVCCSFGTKMEWMDFVSLYVVRSITTPGKPTVMPFYRKHSIITAEKKHKAH